MLGKVWEYSILWGQILFYLEGNEFYTLPCRENGKPFLSTRWLFMAQNKLTDALRAHDFTHHNERHIFRLSTFASDTHCLHRSGFFPSLMANIETGFMTWCIGRTDFLIHYFIF